MQFATCFRDLGRDHRSRKCRFAKPVRWRAQDCTVLPQSTEDFPASFDVRFITSAGPIVAGGAQQRTQSGDDSSGVEGQGGVRSDDAHAVKALAFRQEDRLAQTGEVLRGNRRHAFCLRRDKRPQ